ncbi:MULTISPECIES: hypothetical protein [unclassified Luteibacter]|uniref:hypothetical protein n=1 Tax=Luteibacter sp. PvP019 TaxID=3156436 RepID=UPI00339457CE
MLTAEGRKYKAELEARIEARIAAFKIEQRELLEELASVGIRVDIVNRLTHVSASTFRHALPIILNHLKRHYSAGTLESLARLLARKEAQPRWDDIVSMYKASAGQKNEGPGDVNMALAAAVAASCPPRRIPELIELLRDHALPNRVLLLAPIRRRRGTNRGIADVIAELRHDPELSIEINSWKVLGPHERPLSH